VLDILIETPAVRGTILVAHGSRDPLWRGSIEAVARQILSVAPQAQVRCAYLELAAPDLPTSVAELVALGVDTITVVPLLLGVGKHAREDLAGLMGLLRTNYPNLQFCLRPAMGEETQIIELMARIAMS
jgi:sirohydrochlorin cobaltochelatase